MEIFEGVIIRDLSVYSDERGWLMEVFRRDELPRGFMPQMGYVSLTHPGVVRGPHEHIKQTDYFCFLGEFNLYLWDNRKGSPSYGKGMIIRDMNRKIAIVPPGIVHAYKNAGSVDALVLNFPDKLYRGEGKREEVDEVRYENIPDTPFRVELLEEGK
ncbi:MAG: dTDP-4-dehydrorhamnose 3,5-epimerase [Nitrospirae bacterium]|nr:MAG: dTDP-4-dehydrorhamnose 3,5-epimerase [Nitrospirota bacterium]